MNQTDKVMVRVDQALILSAELGELMKQPNQPNYLAKLQDLTARMKEHMLKRP